MLCDRGYVQHLVRPLGGVCVARRLFLTALAYDDDGDFHGALQVETRSRKTGTVQQYLQKCNRSSHLTFALPQHIKYNAIITVIDSEHFTTDASHTHSITISQPYAFLKMRYSPIAAGFLTLVSHPEMLARAASCECGFTVNTTSDKQFAVFTDYFESDLLHDFTETSDNGTTGIPASWCPQGYNAPARNVRGPVGMSRQVGNIIPNPMPNRTWGGEPAHMGEAGMQLWVRQKLLNNMVPVAEVASSRDDMLYGSFRAAIKFTGTNGTAGTFAWYRNDTQEIDMAFFSKDPKTVHLLVHSPESKIDIPGVSKADLPLGDPFYSRDLKKINILAHPPESKSGPEINIPHVSDVDLPQGFHEYRFDWMPDRIDFYLDSSLAWTVTENIPSSPGHLLLSHLSNGNPDWSGGPPVDDSVMTVAYVKAYFNTTASSEQPRLECGALRQDTFCVVLDQPTPLEPAGKTHFYSKWLKEHKDDDNTFTASGSDVKSDHSTAASFGMSSLVWTFVGAVCSVVYCLA